MSPETENVIEKALRLPKDARALLAEKLLESLDHEEEFEVPPEWREEIRRRCRELDEGKAELISGDRVFEELKEKLG
jgi:putative addiction module component (TIGR02574 family)